MSEPEPKDLGEEDLSRLAEAKSERKEGRFSSRGRKKNLTPKQRRKRKTVSSFIFFAALTALVVSLMIVLFRGENRDSFDAAFVAIGQGRNWIYLLISLLIVLVYFAIYPLTMLTFSKALDSEAKPVDSWLIANSEHFYNGVTPSSVGGQPFQAYALTGCDVSGSKSSAIILMNYINLVAASVFFGFVSLVYYPNYVEGLKSVSPNTDLSSLQWLAVIGIILNALNLAFFCLLGFSRKTRHFIVSVVVFFCKFKWIGKHLSKAVPTLKNYLRDTQSAAKAIVAHPRVMIIAFVERVLIMSLLYCMPFFLLQAVGVQVGWDRFMMVMLGTAFASVCVAWFPTPGGVGAGEWVSLVVIGSVAMKMGHSFDASISSAVMFLWRGLSFYLVLLLSFLVSAIFEGRLNAKLKKEELLEEKEENRAENPEP